MICILACSFGLPVIFSANELTNTSSEPLSYNEDTGYAVYLDDGADLLSTSEESDLCDAMFSITGYGNVAFVSIKYNAYSSVEDFGEAYGYSLFGNDSYTLFIIDMDYRKVCVYSDGEIYKTITDAYAYTITDNIYTYASDAEYYECAYHAFDQIYTLLEGRRIAQPMKYISNILLSLVLALLINYFIVMSASRSKKASDAQLLNNIYTKVEVNNTRSDFLHQSKQYSPQQTSSSSSGGGGSRSSGGGGGGGGGSHSF